MKKIVGSIVLALVLSACSLADYEVESVDTGVIVETEVREKGNLFSGDGFIGVESDNDTAAEDSAYLIAVDSLDLYEIGQRVKITRYSSTSEGFWVLTPTKLDIEIIK